MRALSGKKLCRIQGKSAGRGGRIQLNLHDGRNILVERKSQYKRGDSILIELPSQKIIRHFSLDKGNRAVIIAGRNTGIEGKIKDIRVKKTMLEKSTVVLESDGREIETLLDYAMVTSGTGAAVPKAAAKSAKDGKK